MNLSLQSYQFVLSHIQDVDVTIGNLVFELLAPKQHCSLSVDLSEGELLTGWWSVSRAVDLMP